MSRWFVDVWNGLPEGFRDFLSSDLASWLAVGIAVTAMVIVWRARAIRTYLRVLDDPSATRARRDGRFVTVIVTVMCTPTAISLAIEHIKRRVWLDGKEVEETESNCERLLQTAYDGTAHIAIEVKVDDPTQQATEARVDMHLKLRDGSRIRVKRTLPIR